MARWSMLVAGAVARPKEVGSLLPKEWAALQNWEGEEGFPEADDMVKSGVADFKIFAIS